MDSCHFNIIQIPKESTFDYNKQIDPQSIELIPLEQNKDNVLTVITKIFILDGSIIIYDKNLEAIAIYKKDGKFDKMIVPNKEIKNIFNMTINCNTKQILIHDDREKKVYHLNMAGDLIDTTDMTFFFEDFATLEDDSRLTFASIYNDKVNFFKHVKSSLFKGSLQRLESYVPDFKMIKHLRDEYVPKRILYSSKREIFYTPLFSNDIYSIKKDSIKLVYKLDFEGEGIEKVIKGKTTSTFIKQFNSHKYYSFDGAIWSTQNKVFLGIQKNGYNGYFLDKKSGRLVGGQISMTVNFDDRAILPNFSYPIGVSADKFISIITPPYNLNANYSDQLLTVLKNNPNSPLLLLYNVK
ncbi:6-bladed beta-propeller [Sphingobacterium sp. 2149]|uniref:6-bladed beta-propeller n=1 Tax=Sphingobacterium sp. 2149 TaxID=2817763 RepID=UPI00286481A3|nr:6-bladed beta-propeller [Sphingobacterium sp. 2149]MDR6733490.1 hypothetical protein [Sphingobacterium sp. 2149]